MWRQPPLPPPPPTHGRAHNKQILLFFAWHINHNSAMLWVWGAAAVEVEAQDNLGRLHKFHNINTCATTAVVRWSGTRARSSRWRCLTTFFANCTQNPHHHHIRFASINAARQVVSIQAAGASKMREKAA